MKTPTKQELKDRIAELEQKNAHLVKVAKSAMEENGELEIRIEGLKLDIIRPTVAAYVLLATLAVITVWEVIL